MLKKIIKFLLADRQSVSYPELPEVKESGESNIPGLYLIGDIAGAPLVKVSLNSGYKLGNTLAKRLENVTSKEDEYDVIIAGAGIAGTATALRLKEKGRKALTLEADNSFQTLRNFTKGKILYAEPTSLHVMGSLPFEESETEDVLTGFEQVINETNLPIIEHDKVTDIKKDGDLFRIITGKKTDGYKCRYVVLAIGKAGNPRKAGVPGEKENPEKVLHIMKDPADFKDKNIIVYGGGDVALEAAISLSTESNVILAYRGNSFTRPKPRNIELVMKKQHQGALTVEFNTVLKEIAEKSVTLKNRETGEVKSIENDYVFEMLGSLAPTGFFRKIGIKMEFAWGIKRILTLIFSFILIYLLYSWKKGFWPFPDAGVGIHKLPSVLKNTSFWYSALYSLLMLIFGLKAMKRWSKQWKDKYQIYRFASLILFQIISFVMIECVFAVFLPENTWWRAYAVNNPFPLLFDSFYNMSGVSVHDLRWIFVGLGALMTFVVIPIAVRWHGKRFCTWICGCGGLAETFGDKWRHHSPKGERSRKLEIMGTLVMFWAFITGGVILFTYSGDTQAAGKWHSAYALLVDFWLVAVIPVALYPIFGGKIWCRYWCPLAKYMQILSKWYGRLQITSNDHCIQCTKCSRYCQVGVDVMAFAKNQQPFSNKNSSCIHCGICITVCPMNVLKFELEEGTVKSNMKKHETDKK